MNATTAFVLLGFGLGALVMVNGAAQREPSLRTRADDLRQRALEAQRISARASQSARDAAARWSAAEDAARTEKGR